MSELESKAALVLPILEARGPVFLFGLVERDDGKWDVVLSSQWSDERSQEAVRAIADHLVPRLSKEELSMLSRIVSFPSSDPAVAAFTRAMHVENGTITIRDSVFFGLEIKRAVLFRSVRPPAHAPVLPASAVNEGPAQA